MKITPEIKILFFALLIICLNNSCKNENHIDHYKVNLDSLKTLPNYFYAHRRGRIYLEDENLENYRIWFNLDNFGNIQDISKVEDFKYSKNDDATTINTYKIDTGESKLIAQKFIDLSRKFKFGHINIDKENKISFSYKDGLSEQYVKTLNDSLKEVYLKKKDFRLLENGWFENIER